MYLSKSTLRIKIRRTVKKLETILVLERKKERKEEIKKNEKRKMKKWKKEDCTYVNFKEVRTYVNFEEGRTYVDAH